LVWQPCLSLAPLTVPLAPRGGGRGLAETPRSVAPRRARARAASGRVGTRRRSARSSPASSAAKFQLQVSKTKADIEGWKKDIKANDVNVLKKFHIETADELLYESAVMGPEFHLVANVKMGDDIYSCEDVKGPTFTKADAEAMLKACHSLAKK